MVLAPAPPFGAQFSEDRQHRQPENMAVLAAAGEDRQAPELTIFPPAKGRNHAKNAKIVKIVNVFL
jgi:hypothetical protein